ncbi:hypothetical protein BDR26DRAFT_865688 [Obelidium mucronatum]|nr:hypothetical protein BDR26DRAFT_865688 [Obelidium mucronatum]
MIFKSVLPEVAALIIQYLPLKQDLQNVSLATKSVFSDLILYDLWAARRHCMVVLPGRRKDLAGFPTTDIWKTLPLTYRTILFEFLIQSSVAVLGWSHLYPASAKSALVFIKHTLTRFKSLDEHEAKHALLLWACDLKHGRVDAVKLVLEAGSIDPAASKNFAILNASKNGYLDVVNLLMQDVRVNPADGNNAAIVGASRAGHVRVIDRLLQDARVRDGLRPPL